MAQKTGMRAARRGREHDARERSARAAARRSRRSSASPLLGRVPLDPALREAGDRGVPVVESRARLRVGASDLRDRGRRRGRAPGDDPQAADRPVLAAVRPEEARARLAALGFAADDVEILFDHFDDAESRGKLGHGHCADRVARDAEPRSAGAARKTASQPGFDRWEAQRRARLPCARGDLRRACRGGAPAGPRRRRATAFPSGHLGYWVRWLAEAGLVAAPDGLVAREAGAPGRRRAARRHEPACDRVTELRGCADRRGRLDGRRRPTAT